MAPFIAAMVFAISFLVRVYWAIVGTTRPREIFILRVWNASWWGGFFRQMANYCSCARNRISGGP